MKLGIVIMFCFVWCRAEDQCSRYHYEEQILAKVLRMEYRLKQLENKVDNNGGEATPMKIIMDCPDNWIRFNGSCYLFEDKRYAFFDAKSHCQRLNSNLVHINDAAENDFLKRHLKTFKNIWIGLEDNNKEGDFRWVDDNTSPAFTSWHVRNPDNYQGKEHCVCFYYFTTYNWNDDQCIKAYGSICEMKAKL